MFVVWTGRASRQGRLAGSALGTLRSQRGTRLPGSSQSAPPCRSPGKRDERVNTLYMSVSLCVCGGGGGGEGDEGGECTCRNFLVSPEGSEMGLVPFQLSSSSDPYESGL